MKPVVSKCPWRAAEHERLHNRDTRDFVTVQPRDPEEDDEDCVCESGEDDDSNSSCSSGSDSGSSRGMDAEMEGPDEVGDRQRRGVLQCVEQKIADFFRRKPGAEQRQPVNDRAKDKVNQRRNR
jgi:hypothetical protein